MFNRRPLAALLLALSTTFGGCAMLPSAADDLDGSQRLEAMRAINAQMQQVLVQRQGGYAAPAAVSMPAWRPSPSQASTPGTPPRCRSRELMCDSRQYCPPLPRC